MEQREKNLLGIGFVVLGMLIFSLQDVAVKRFSGQYPILEIVLFRSLTALPVTLLFFRAEGRHGLPTTRRPLLEIIRGGFYFLSFTTYMMGVAALPLGDMAAIRNSAPLMITLLSAMFLGEGISLPRWLGLLTGFVGGFAHCPAGYGNLQSGVGVCPDCHPVLRAECHPHPEVAQNRQQCYHGVLQFAGVSGRVFPAGAAFHAGGRNARCASQHCLFVCLMAYPLTAGLAHHAGVGTGLGGGDVLYRPRLQSGTSPGGCAV